MHGEIYRAMSVDAVVLLNLFLLFILFTIPKYFCLPDFTSMRSPPLYLPLSTFVQGSGDGTSLVLLVHSLSPDSVGDPCSPVASRAAVCRPVSAGNCVDPTLLSACGLSGEHRRRSPTVDWAVGEQAVAALLHRNPRIVGVRNPDSPHPTAVRRKYCGLAGRVDLLLCHGQPKRNWHCRSMASERNLRRNALLVSL